MENIKSFDEMTENIDKVSDEEMDYKHNSKNELSCQVKSEYSESSFDRFGDDLTELIISYLPIKDKFRFECLSKRIQSLIFNKQTKLILTVDRLDPAIINTIQANYLKSGKRFESILIKMKWLTYIKIIGDPYYSSYVLHLNDIIRQLADNCHYLRSLVIGTNFHVSEETIEYFGQRCGQQIKEISVFSNRSNAMVSRLLSWMTNLRDLKTISISSILTDHHKWTAMKRSKESSAKLPKLKSATFHQLPTKNELAHFAEEYARTEVTLSLDFKPQFYKMKSNFDGYSFEHLTRLDLFAEYMDFIGPNVVRRMAKHCHHLRTLKMQTNSMEGLFRELGRLTQLERLQLTLIDIGLSSKQDNCGSIADLRPIIGLRHLSLHMNINDQTLIDIDSHLPQLQSLSLNVVKRMSEQTLKSISRLKCLKALSIEVPFTDQKLITDSDVIFLVENSLSLRHIEIVRNYPNPIEITVESVESLAKKAKLNPKIDYYLTLSGTYGQQNRVLIDSQSIPPNLYLCYTCNNAHIIRNIYMPSDKYYQYL